MTRRGSTEPRDGEQKRSPAARDEGAVSLELVTDGGEEPVTTASETERNRFQTLFVDVTGAEEVITEQAADTSSHAIDDDATSISAYVTDVARRDGLIRTVVICYHHDGADQVFRDTNR